MFVGASDASVCLLEFAERPRIEKQLEQLARHLTSAPVIGENDLTREVATQLERYFAGQLREFSIPLSLGGSDFQVLVWEALRSIPYGETRSYGEIAEQIGRPIARRAVGVWALHDHEASRLAASAGVVTRTASRFRKCWRRAAAV